MLSSTCAVSSSARLGTNLLELPGLRPSQRRQHAADKWEQVLNPVRPCYDQNHAKWQRGYVLLALELPVHGDECVDAATRAVQELAVLDARPAQALDRDDVVPYQRGDQVVGQVLVK